MATSNFENRMLVLANRLIDAYGQYSIVLQKDDSLVDSNKPWLGKPKRYMPFSIKMVAKTLDNNLLGSNNDRRNNLQTTFLIAGDRIATIKSDDLLFKFNGKLSKMIALQNVDIATDTSITTSSIYNIDTTSGDITLSLDVSIENYSVLYINRLDTTNNIIINVPNNYTINNSVSYTITKSEGIVGFMLEDNNYFIVDRSKIEAISKVAPSGNKLLYKIEVGA